MNNNYKKLSKINCNICPRACNLAVGQIGFCHARINTGEEIVPINYGITSGLAIDPIEKKPLYHFYPNSKALSFGTFGCNMGCTFCQNSSISKIQFDKAKAIQISPHQIVELAHINRCKSIAYTYNEPIISYEYTTNTAKIAKSENIKNVLVSAGYISKENRKNFFKDIDAANIDIKAFNKNFYEKYCYADIKIVLETIEYIVKETDCEIELTTLIIEGLNDNVDDLKREFEYIAKLSKSIPIHLSAFHPAYKMINHKTTSEKTILKAVEIAKTFELENVYSGNILDEKTSTTSCPKCHYKLIQRYGYKTEILTSDLKICPNCKQEIYGKF
jgi:pyruvate formate lyase activating enzyme